MPRGRKQDAQDKPAALVRFEDWMRTMGITWDEAALDLRPGAPGCSGPAYGVFATADSEEGHVLCEIPKKSILSVRNTEVADIIQAEELGGGLGLILAVMHEHSLGARSAWWPYLHALPAREYLPIFWTDDELALLQGTGLDERASSDRQLTAEDWEAHIAPLAAKYPRRLKRAALTLDSFRMAASWVASRAFGVDSWHGLPVLKLRVPAGQAMVPLADIFNHKAAVVSLAEGYTLEPACLADDRSSDDSGDYSPDDGGDSDAHDDGVTSHTEKAGATSDSDEQASADHHEPQHGGVTDNGKPLGLSGHDRWQIGAAVEPPAAAASTRNGKRKYVQMTRGGMLDEGLLKSQGLRLDIGICSGTRGDEEIMEIVAASPLRGGHEVFNTYGELSNAELVHKYGFALRVNPFNAITLDKEAVIAAASAHLGERAARRRCRFLSQFSELLDEDREPFELLPNAVLGPSLAVVLHVLFAPDSVFASLHSLEGSLSLLYASTSTPTISSISNAADSSTCEERPQVLTVDAVALGANGVHHNGSAASAEDSSAIGQPPHALPATDAPPAAGGEWSGAAAEVQNVKIAESTENVLTPAACAGLQAVLTEQLQRYSDVPCKEQLRELNKLQKSSQRSEAVSARIAALTLVIGEKEMLQDAIMALDAKQQQLRHKRHAC